MNSLIPRLTFLHRRFPHCLGVGFCLLAAMIRLHGQTALVNPDLKITEGAVSAVQGWQVSPTNTVLATETKDLPSGAGSALKITVGEVSTSSGSLVQRLPLPVGSKRLVLTGYVKSTQPRAGYLEIKLYRGKTELSRDNGGLLSSQEWQQVSVSVDPRVKDKQGVETVADRMEVLCRWYRQQKHLGGSVWFANLRLSEATDAPAVSGGALAPRSTEVGQATLRIVPTYENASVYVEKTGYRPDELKVSYREKGAAGWIEAHALSISSNDVVPRGSLFGLKPGTAYEVRCEDSGGKAVVSQEFVTWTDSVPVARTVNVRTLAPNGGPIRIDAGGTAEGWVRYVADPGFVIDGGAESEQAVLVEKASYVILDGLVVRGGRRHGIQLKSAQNVRIQNCDIAGFGRVGVQDLERGGKYYMAGETKAVNWDAGVYVGLSGNITIERCYIHDARNHANSWFYSHPEGPNAIFVRSTGGMVIRYNDLVASERHRWNDVIEGYGNSNVDGGFNRDSDIYGNYLAFPNDDGIELDGGQCNVRFYGNKLEGGLCGISTAPNLRGPSFVFGNLVVNLGDERGAASAAVKNGGGPTHSKGVSYFYHNTFLTFGNGLTAVGFGGDKGLRGQFRGHARNNVFATTGAGISDSVRAPANTYDHDLFASAMGGAGDYEVAGAVEARGVKVDAGFVDAGRGLLGLAETSAGRGAGARVPGLAAFQPAEGPVTAGVWWEGVGAMRPTAATLDHGQVVLNSVKEGARVTKSVILKSAAAPKGAGVGFRVLKNESASWLSVTPSSGTLKPGESVALELGFDSAGRVGSGLLLGAAIVKFDNGDSLPLTVYATAASAPLRRLFEAEQLEGHGQFTAVADAAASGGAAVSLVDETVGKTGTGAKALELMFNAPAAGAYYVNFRIRCAMPYANHDSMFVSVNGAAPQVCALVGAGKWTWTRLTGKTMHLPLQSGPNRIRLIPREEVEIDAVLVGDRPLMAGESLEAFLGGQ